MVCVASQLQAAELEGVVPPSMVQCRVCRVTPLSGWLVFMQCW